MVACAEYWNAWWLQSPSTARYWGAMAEDDVELVRRTVEAWNRRDDRRAYLAPDPGYFVGG